MSLALSGPSTMPITVDDACKQLENDGQLARLFVSIPPSTTSIELPKLLASLQKSSSLAELQFAANSLDDDGVGAVATALRENTTLTMLKIAFSPVTGPVAARLLESTRLKSLDLTGCSVMRQNFTPFITALERNQTLQELYARFADVGSTLVGPFCVVESLI